MATQKVSPFDSGFALRPFEVRSLASEGGRDGSVDDLSSTAIETASAVDLALDLVLNEIVQEARLTTSATGAVIALVQGGKILCRAASGATASAVANYLNVPSTIAETCVRFGLVQRCDDCETDSRVDAVTCRRVGVRSLIVVPVQSQEEVNLGVIEVFSGNAQAFSERDVLVLQALSRRITESMERTKRVMAAPPVVSLSPDKPQPAPKFRFPDVKAPLAKFTFKVSLIELPRVKLPRIKLPSVNFNLERKMAVLKAWTQTGMLPISVAVLTLALVLGWLLGWRAANVNLPAAGKPTLGRSSVRAKSRAQTSQNAAAGLATTAQAGRVPVVTDRIQRAAGIERMGNSAPADGLVVYEKGKMIFRAQSSQLPERPIETFVAVPKPAATRQEAVSALPPTAVVAKREIIAVPPSAPRSARNESAPAAPAVPVVSEPQSLPVSAPVVASVPALAHPSPPPVFVPEETAYSYLSLRIEPDYPESAKQEEKEGVIYLAIIVGKNGSVQRVSVLSGDRQLLRAAVDAVRQWRFKPLMRNGQAVSFETRVEMPYAFSSDN